MCVCQPVPQSQHRCLQGESTQQWDMTKRWKWVRDNGSVYSPLSQGCGINKWVFCDQPSKLAGLGAGSTGHFWPQQCSALKTMYLTYEYETCTFMCLSPEGIQGWKVIFLAEHAAFPKSAWLAFHGACGRYKHLAPECVRNSVPGRGQLESGAPGRAGEGQTGHVLERNTILAIQRNSFWKMVT